jgi:predicted DNA-binding transcriptional regulator AlpA
MEIQKKQVYTILEFCRAYSMSKPFFYKLIKNNKAPKIMRVGARVYITKEAALEWQRSMEK